MIKYRNRMTKEIVEVIFKDDISVIYGHESWGRTYCSRSVFDYSFEEYKEPRRGVLYANLYENPDKTVLLGAAVESRAEIDRLPSAKIRIGVVKIEWVEGQNPE